jgi:thiamine-phosphate pyrophosphorylase
MSCLIYYITDRNQLRGDEARRRRALLAKVAEAARAGVDYIQLREKDLGARDLEALAREVAAVVRENSTATRLLINSRTDVALAAGADGVHLRADDIAPTEVRRMLGSPPGQEPASVFSGSGTPQSHALPNNISLTAPKQFLVAVSCHSAEDVISAESGLADFAVCAPVFEKNNASGTQPIGAAVLQQACRANIPVLALGGVTLENAASCLHAGAAGIAGIRIFQENTIEDVVRELRAL